MEVHDKLSFNSSVKNRPPSSHSLRCRNDCKNGIFSDVINIYDFFFLFLFFPEILFCI